MATLSLKKSGCWSIQFFNEEKQKKTITLPSRFKKKTAEELRRIVEDLLCNRYNNIPFHKAEQRTKVWVQTAPELIREKLANHDLIPIIQNRTAKELWDSYLAQKKGVKDTTLKTYEAAHRRFFSYFEENDPISKLTTQQIRDWKTFLLNPFLEATVTGTFAKTKAVFNWAVEKGWLEESPLKGVWGGSYVNSENDRFIEMEEYFQLLESATCQEWRVIISLARIGGLHCPSELLILRWSDIDWEKQTFTAWNQKIEHHEGKAKRYVPLFTLLRKELELLWERDKSKEPEFVINRYRNPNTNLGTEFARIVKRAGIDKIPRPFDNMRASRSTEIYAEHGDLRRAWRISRNPVDRAFQANRT